MASVVVAVEDRPLHSNSRLRGMSVNAMLQHFDQCLSELRKRETISAMRTYKPCVHLRE